MKLKSRDRLRTSYSTLLDPLGCPFECSPKKRSRLRKASANLYRFRLQIFNLKRVSRIENFRTTCINAGGLLCKLLFDRFEEKPVSFGGTYWNRELGYYLRMLCFSYPVRFAVPGNTPVPELVSQDLPGRSQRDAQDCPSEKYPAAQFVILAGSGRVAYSDSRCVLLVCCYFDKARSAVAWQVMLLD